MKLNFKRKLINVEKEPFCFSQFNSPAFDEVTNRSNKNAYGKSTKYLSIL